MSANITDALTQPRMQAVASAVDETDAFNLTTRSTPLPPPARRRVAGTTLTGSGPTVHYRSVARLAYVTDDPKTDFNGRRMSCIAVQSGFAKVVATAILVVRRMYSNTEPQLFRTLLRNNK